MTGGQLAVVFVLFGAVAVTGVAVVYAKHTSRGLFVEQQKLRAMRDAVDIDWGRLQLELATWGTDSQVEKLARERLNMREPSPHEVVVLVR